MKWLIDKLKQHIPLKLFLVFVWLILGQLAVTQTLFHDSINRFNPQRKSKTEQMHFYNRMATGLYNTDTGLARRQAYEGIRIAREINDLYGLAFSYYTLGRIEIVKNRLDEARISFNKAISIIKDTPHQSLYADIIEYLCYIYELQGEYEEVKRLALNMIQIRVKTNEVKKIPSSYLILGNISQLNGKYDSALLFFNNALKLYEQNRNQSGKAKVFNNIGNVHYYLGNYDTAIQYYLKALTIKIEQKDILAQSKSLNNIASIYYQTENWSKALYYYRNCLSLLLTPGNESHLAVGYGNIGLVLYNLEQYDSAMYYFSKALTLYERHKIVKGIASTRTNIGLIKHDLGKYNEALADFNAALRLNKELNDEAETALTLQHISSTCFAMGRHDEALKYGMQSMGMVRRHGLKKQEMDLHELLSKVYKGKGAFKQALKHLNAFINIKDSIFSNEQREELDRIVEKYEMERKEKQIDLLTTEKKNMELELQRRSLITYGISVIFLLFAVIGLLLLNRFRIKKNHTQMSMEMKLLEAEHRLTQNKLNPHAISNVLKTIDQHVKNQNTEQASLYINRFELFIRHLLEKSAGSVITLRQEIEFLKIYLSMECDFASKKFEWTIDLAPELNPDITEIPQMFIQPYVENAIKHGLRYLEGNGFIHISFEKTDHHLICCIVDNGIGRKASTELYRQKQALYPSTGSNLLEERLLLLKKLNIIDITQETTDLFDKTGQPLGTKVIIRFEVDD